MLDSLCVLVYLQPNGDARVLEKRVMRVEGDYSEGYTIVAPLEEGSHMKNFKVFDDHGERYYQYVADWSTVHGLHEQTEKCGIMYGDDGGYKLCWGMGHEGYRQYWVEYVITSLVRGYGDCDAFVRQIIAPDAQPLPRFFCVIVNSDGHEFVPEEVKAEVTGFPQKARVDGTVTVWPLKRSQLATGEHVTLECRFKKGIFDPELITDESFKGNAPIRSDAPQMNLLSRGRTLLIGLLAIVVIGLVCVVAFVVVMAYMRRRK